MSRFLDPVWWGFKEKFATCHLEHQSLLYGRGPGTVCRPAIVVTKSEALVMIKIL